jgi:hypothetical protein
MRAPVAIEDIRFIPNPRSMHPHLQYRFKYTLNLPTKRRAWVAKLGMAGGRLTRDFLAPSAKDMSDASSTANRGVMLYFWLNDGIYDISSPVSWRNVDRYYCVVANGVIHRITESEVIKCLRKD